MTGCGMSSLTSGLGSSVFGGGSSSSGSESSGVSEEQLLTAAKSTETGGIPGGEIISHGCPRMIIAPRDRNVTVYEPGRVGDGLAIMHRGEITKTARECYFEQGRVTVKYGFSGRVLLGPRGQGGNISLPVTVAVNDAKHEKVQTDQMRVDVSVATENPIGYFSAVRTVTFSIAEGARPGEYELQVGFDHNIPNAG
jgi:hypothetical protein